MAEGTSQTGQHPWLRLPGGPPGCQSTASESERRKWCSRARWMQTRLCACGGGSQSHCCLLPKGWMQKHHPGVHHSSLLSELLAVSQGSKIKNLSKKTANPKVPTWPIYPASLAHTCCRAGHLGNACQYHPTYSFGMREAHTQINALCGRKAALTGVQKPLPWDRNTKPHLQASIRQNKLQFWIITLGH